MVMISMPSWYKEAEEKLNKTIDDIVRKNNIDWHFSHDSLTLEQCKEAILSVLVAIWERVDVQERKKLEEFNREIKKAIKKQKGDKI